MSLALAKRNNSMNKYIMDLKRKNLNSEKKKINKKFSFIINRYKIIKKLF